MAMAVTKSPSPTAVHAMALRKMRAVKTDVAKITEAANPAVTNSVAIIAAVKTVVAMKVAVANIGAVKTVAVNQALAINAAAHRLLAANPEPTAPETRGAHAITAQSPQALASSKTL